MRITTKGQVTIPAEIREQAGLLPETEVEFKYDGEVVSIMKVKETRRPGRGAQIVAHLTGRATGGMTTDEIMALTRGED